MEQNKPKNEKNDVLAPGGNQEPEENVMSGGEQQPGTDVMPDEGPDPEF